MTNSARLSGRPSSSAAYNVGDVVDTPDSAIKSWRYLGAGEWEPNDAVRYTTGPGGGVGIAAVGSASLAFGDEVLPQPSGFDWAPPVSFWRKNGEVHHDFNPEDWMSVTSASLWVATTGNDSTGDGTFASPYQSVGKAIDMMSGPTTIYLMAGVFNRLRTWADKSPAYNCNVIASGVRYYQSAGCTLH